MRRLVYLVLPWLAVAQACTTGRSVRPVGAGKAAVGVSLGGPVIGNLGPPAPLPIAAAYLRLGMGPRTDLDAAAYLPISRVVGLDVGASHLVVDPRGSVPALMLGVRLLGFAATHGHRLRRGSVHRTLVEATARASWIVGPRHLLFVGLDALAQPRQPSLSPQLSVGWQGQLAPRWRLSAELRWLSFARRSDHLVVHYVGLGNRGSLGLQLGASYTFPLGRRARIGAHATRRQIGGGR